MLIDAVFFIAWKTLLAWFAVLFIVDGALVAEWYHHPGSGLLCVPLCVGVFFLSHCVEADPSECNCDWVWVWVCVLF